VLNSPRKLGINKQKVQFWCIQESRKRALGSGKR